MKEFAKIFVIVAPWAVMFMLYWTLQRQIDRLRKGLKVVFDGVGNLSETMARAADSADKLLKMENELRAKETE